MSEAKQRLSLILIVGLAILLAVPSVVLGQDDSADTATDSETTQNDTSDTSTDGSDTAADREAARAEREAARQADIEARQAEREAAITERIDAARAAVITERCEAAQTRIAERLTRAQEVSADRQSTYASIAEKATNIIARVTEQGVDASQLQAALDTFTSLQNSFASSASSYVLALEDLSTMDCAADPEAFQLALTDARNQLASVIGIASDIKTVVSNDMRLALQAIADALAANGDSSDSSDTTTNETGA